MNLCSLRELRALLERHGFHFSKSMGQNFLIAPWVPERIASASGAGPGRGVLEVGPGVGCLTVELADRADKVVCVELDRSLEPVLAETLSGFSNVELLFGDILKQSLPALAAQHFPGLEPMVCANLPYNITTPALTAFLEAGVFTSITVMIQKEVARRLCARPGTGDYGAFSVFTQWHAAVEILFDVPPDCFCPRPKVTSAVVQLRPRPAPPVPVRDEVLFFRVVRAAFNQRRKTLLNALSNGLGSFDKAAIAAAIERAGLPPQIRGEALDIPAFAALADALAADGR